MTTTLTTTTTTTTTGVIGPEEEKVYRNLYYADLFIDDLANEFQCSICLAIMNDPMLVNCPAQHMYCRLCITTSLATKQSCPLDRQAVTMDDVRPLPAIKRVIDGLRMKCPNHAEGCEKTDTVSVMGFHIFECSRGGCGTDPSMSRNDVFGKEITVKVSHDGKPRYLIKAYENDVVLALKRRIGDRLGIQATDVVINLNQQVLDEHYDSRTLSECNIRDGSLVWWTDRTHGGIDYQKPVIFLVFKFLLL
ncbi:TNF receptor-associated factor 6-like [Oppia nitens]|uniref:TNF receptor-associated factor 6-like n=1 Tax=Oppia nitens TaxID=1686743 RepID=UPI0023DC879A|nr:TNF receptor-associated factor 6-like [Oppia nitens]XP_054153788.1 TNF receptor-associated factor 6-like [Oppia nitens]